MNEIDNQKKNSKIFCFSVFVIILKWKKGINITIKSILNSKFQSNKKKNEITGNSPVFIFHYVKTSGCHD